MQFSRRRKIFERGGGNSQASRVDTFGTTAGRLYASPARCQKLDICWSPLFREAQQPNASGESFCKRRRHSERLAYTDCEARRHLADAIGDLSGFFHSVREGETRREAQLGRDEIGIGLNGAGQMTGRLGELFPQDTAYGERNMRLVRKGIERTEP
jgi:hypothetical protein